MTAKPRLLDLFCGAGGAAMGYHRAGFDVTGVDIKPQPHYPFEFVQADALEYCAAHGHEFDVIHASPPCQAYTGMRNITISRFGAAPEHPDLVDDTRRALRATGRHWIIENVQNSPIDTHIILCGVSLGLPELARHRHFESDLCCLRNHARIGVCRTRLAFTVMCQTAGALVILNSVCPELRKDCQKPVGLWELTG